MLIRFTTSFRLIDSTFDSLDAVCDALCRSLRDRPVRDVKVDAHNGMVWVEFIVEADGFTEANISSGKMLLSAMNDIGLKADNRTDIDRISRLGELDDLSDLYLPEQARQLVLVSE